MSEVAVRTNNLQYSSRRDASPLSKTKESSRSVHEALSFDPYAGLNPDLPDVDKAVLVSRSSIELVSMLMEEVLDLTIKEAEVGRLLKFNESYGTNHTLQNCLITIEWISKEQDLNIETVDFEDDS